MHPRDRRFAYGGASNAHANVCVCIQYSGAVLWGSTLGTLEGVPFGRERKGNERGSLDVVEQRGAERLVT